MSKIFIAAVLALAFCYVNGETCSCPNILTPVCGSDYQTYINKCEFNCARRVKTDLTIAYNGRCKSPKVLPVKCSCTTEFIPVCGTNGRTYGSPCLLECEQSTISDVKIAHNGVCKTPKNSASKNDEPFKCSCTTEFNPVCGSNGRTYSSPCFLECEQSGSSDLKIAHVGSCQIERKPATKKDESAKCSCTTEFSPVCGSNGRTYSSPCFLQCQQRVSSDLKIAHVGSCQIERKPATKKSKAVECSCTTEFSPVCGSNGRTYSSPCFLECEQLVSSDLKIAHVGSCQIERKPAIKNDDAAKCSCTMEYSPVCGSNGRTYSSPCYLECQQRVSSDLKIAHVGSCQIERKTATKKDEAAKCSCTLEFSPVCGSNGRTYSSPCYLECDQSMTSDLKVAHIGVCKSPKMSTNMKHQTSKCSCTMDFSPVCGSNGRTYSSPCLLECEQKLSTGLRIAHEGPCA